LVLTLIISALESDEFSLTILPFKIVSDCEKLKEEIKNPKRRKNGFIIYKNILKY
jgi:hypothetical protein